MAKKIVSSSGVVVRISISSSSVPGNAADDDRWYRFSIDAAKAPLDAAIPFSASLRFSDHGNLVTVMGPCGLRQVNTSHSVDSPPVCSLVFTGTDIMRTLVPRVLPMDRVRVEILSAQLGPTPWTVFDGFVSFIGDAESSFTDSVSQHVTIRCTSIQKVLEGAIFNWQGFVHPASSVFVTGSAESKRLAEVLAANALPPEKIIRGFIEALIGSTFTLHAGDPDNDQGIPILDLLGFADGSDFISAFNVALPLPYDLIRSKSGSFWSIVQDLSEPQLHECFWDFRKNEKAGGAVPTLVFRPRPFPGREDLDGHWLALPRVEVGPGGAATAFMVETDETDAQHHNCFHWAALNFGDQNASQFNSNVLAGWWMSRSLVNRFGYSSVAVRTRQAPLQPKADDDSTTKDIASFAVDATEHFARQEMPLPFMRSKSYTFQVAPIRPGMVLVDRTKAADKADSGSWTGYVTSVSFNLLGDDTNISISTSVQVSRAIFGVGPEQYPAACRALVPDVEHRTIGSNDLGTDQGQQPSANAGEVRVPKAGPAKKPNVDQHLQATAQAAATRQGIPAWLVMHILQMETSLGMGAAYRSAPATSNTKKNGIGQITSVALADLISHGHLNPDGTAFSAKDRQDDTKCIHAVAAFLKLNKGYLTGEGIPDGVASYYSWVARSYRWGAPSTGTFGRANAWAFPPAGEPFPDYYRYWSPEGIKAAQAMWGNLG